MHTSRKSSKTHRLGTLAGAVLALALGAGATGVAAQGAARGLNPDAGLGATPPAATADVTPRADNYRAMRARDMIGMGVISSQMRPLGTIQDLVINLNTGDVRYAIMSFAPGIIDNDVLFAVPTSQLAPVDDRDALLYRNMNRDRLAVAAIRRTDYNAGIMGDEALWGRIDRAWGIQQPTGTSGAILASDLMDKDVDSLAQDDIGEIESIVINLADSRVHYAVLEFDPGWLSPERDVALPITAFRAPPGRDDLVIDINVDRAAALPALDPNWYARLNEPTYVADIDRYLVTELPRYAGTGTGAMGAGPGTFERLDADDSGWLTRDEVRAVPELNRRWNALDRDDDDRIGRQEFNRWNAPPAR